MALEKAFIKPLEGTRKDRRIEVLFNPGEYSIEKSNQYQSTSLPGVATPITQFVSGNASTLTLDLFFDSYEKGEDVRNYTNKFTDLLKIDSQLHAPPICEFHWGMLVFKATIEKISQKFTLFLDSGIPVRATLNTSFKEYKTITEQPQEEARQSADRTKQRILQEGDNLLLLANREYGDPSFWREIARANQIDNPRLVEIGRELIVPSLE
jgi:Contractile injection system tube protein/LysM domain